MSARDTVQRCWGAEAPDWVVALAAACDQSSYAKVGGRIGYTKGTVHQVLHKLRRPGGLGRLEAAVRAQIMDVRVSCPVLGAIRLSECRERRATPFAATNALRVRLYRACRGCVQDQAGVES